MEEPAMATNRKKLAKK